MAVSTFFPGATAVDGHAGRDSAGETWAAQRGGAGTVAADAGAQPRFAIGTNGASLWQTCYRSILLFDTSSIPDADTIDSATMEIVAIGRVDDFSVGQSASMVASTPASNTALVNGDYSQVNTAKQATDKTLASFTVDSIAYNAFNLNATGLTNISKTGVSKFGLRITSDFDNVEPTVGASKTAQIEWASAEEVLAEDKRPKLVVTHTAAPSTFIPKMLAF